MHFVDFLPDSVPLIIILKNNSKYKNKKMENIELLNFVDFIKKYFPDYIIDEENEKVINDMSLWAARSPEFERIDSRYFLRKGIIIIGNVGTGKSDLFYILMIYLGSYLRINYAFRWEEVWPYAGEFGKNGYSALNNIEKGNCYFNDICLIDKRDNLPRKELCQHMGNKILVGEEIIMKRYDSFKFYGYLSFFSTNADEEEINELYGERAASRLWEMCNVFKLVGDNRRLTSRPNIIRDMNNPAPPVSRGVSVDWEKESKDSIESYYRQFSETGNCGDANLALLYVTMTSFGVKVATDEEMRVIIEGINPSYTPDEAASLRRVSASDKEANKKNFIWEQSKTIAVNRFFQKMKDNNAKSIFGLVDVNTGRMANELAKSKKDI